MEDDLLFRVGAVTTQFESAMGRVIGFAKTAVGAYLGWEAISKTFKAVTEAAKVEEVSMAKLNTAILDSSDGSKQMINSANDLAVTMSQKSTKTAVELRDGLAYLTSGLGSTQLAMQALQPTIDMSIAKNMSMEQSARLVSRAYITGGEALTRIAPELHNVAAGYDALSAIQRKFAGEMENYGKTEEGLEKRRNAAWQTDFAMLGNQLLPAMKYFNLALINTGNEWVKLAETIHLNDIAMWLVHGFQFLVDDLLPKVLYSINRTIAMLGLEGKEAMKKAWAEGSNEEMYKKIDAMAEANRKKTEKEWKQVAGNIKLAFDKDVIPTVEDTDVVMDKLTSSFKNFGSKVVETNFNMKKSFEDLGKTILKNMLNLGIGAITGGMATALSPVLSPITSGLSGLLGSIPHMQSGGITTSDTMAFLHKDEAVVPLSSGNLGPTIFAPNISALDGHSVKQILPEIYDGFVAHVRLHRGGILGHDSVGGAVRINP